MKYIMVAAATVMAVTGVAASAQEAQPQQQEERKICRTTKMTGSLTRQTRICLTETQWRELNARTQRGVGEMQGQGSGGQAVQNNQGAGGS